MEGYFTPFVMHMMYLYIVLNLSKIKVKKALLNQYVMRWRSNTGRPVQVN